jgi:hypothetical protein
VYFKEVGIESRYDTNLNWTYLSYQGDSILSGYLGAGVKLTQGKQKCELIYKTQADRYQIYPEKNTFLHLLKLEPDFFIQKVLISLESEVRVKESKDALIAQRRLTFMPSLNFELGRTLLQLGYQGQYQEYPFYHSYNSLLHQGSFRYKRSLSAMFEVIVSASVGVKEYNRYQLLCEKVPEGYRWENGADLHRDLKANFTLSFPFFKGRTLGDISYQYQINESNSAGFNYLNHIFNGSLLVKPRPNLALYLNWQVFFNLPQDDCPPPLFKEWITEGMEEENENFLLLHIICNLTKNLAFYLKYLAINNQLKTKKERPVFQKKVSGVGIKWKF